MSGIVGGMEQQVPKEYRCQSFFQEAYDARTPEEQLDLYANLIETELSMGIYRHD